MRTHCETTIDIFVSSSTALFSFGFFFLLVFTDNDSTGIMGYVSDMCAMRACVCMCAKMTSCQLRMHAAGFSVLKWRQLTNVERQIVNENNNDRRARARWTHAKHIWKNAHLSSCQKLRYTMEQTILFLSLIHTARVRINSTRWFSRVRLRKVTFSSRQWTRNEKKEEDISVDCCECVGVR